MTISNDETLNLRYEVLNDLINSDEQYSDPENCCIYNIAPENAFFHIENEESDESPLGINLMYNNDFPVVDSALFNIENKDLANFKLNKTRISKNLTFINQEELDKIKKPDADFWTVFREKYPNKCIRNISVPFFSKDRSTCIIKVSTSCGSLDGSGYTGVYQKINGRWIEIKTFNNWIS
ncbi:hypothetical protein [Chryseobacterium indologenes]|nr:hypothetical protein [Chryseobacterium indologenes]